MNEQRAVSKASGTGNASLRADGAIARDTAALKAEAKKKAGLLSAWGQTLAALPVLLLLAGIIALSVQNSRGAWEAPFLFTILNTALLTSIFAFATYMAARSFLLTGSAGNLFFGSATLAFSLGALVAGLSMSRHANPSAAVAIYNISAALSGTLHVLGALSTSARFGLRRVDKGRNQKLGAAYLVTGLLVAIVTVASYQGRLPTFFVTGHGHTMLRQAIIGGAVGLFTLSALFFTRFYLIRKAIFFFWYAVALAVLAVGLLGVMLATVTGDTLDWLGRLTQCLSSLYVIIAYLAVGQSVRGKDIPLERALDRFFREATANYQALVETATDAIISFDHEGRILLWNSAAERIFGFDASEALASPLAWLIVPDERWVRVHHELARLLQKQRNALIDETLETVARRKSGHTFPVEISASARRTADGWIGTCTVRDITDRKRAEDALQKSEQKLRNLIEFSTDGVALVDESGLITEWSRGLEQITGIKRRAVLGRPIHNLPEQCAAPAQPASSEFLESLRDQTLSLLQMGQISSAGHLKEQNIWRSDGTRRIVQSVTFPIRAEQGWMVGSIVRDVTEQRELLCEVQAQRQHAEELAQALAKERDILQTIMENTHAHLVYLDRDFRLVQANSAFIHNSAYREDELVGHNYFDLFPDGQDRTIFDRVRDTGQSTRFEAYPRAVASQPERGLTYWDWTLVPTKDEQNRVDGVVLSLLDVTERERTREELSRHRDHLEEEVAARAGELLAANAKLEQEVIERKRIEETLREAVARLETMNETIHSQREQLRALAARLADAEEIDRRLLSRELHDQVGQNLAALGLNLSLLSAQLPQDCKETFTPQLADSLALVQQTTARVRNLMADLRPPVLDDYGLVAALRWHGERVGSRTGLLITVMGDEPTPRLDDRVEIALFRIAQEALLNVAKHARAREVVLSLEIEDNVVRLLVADDGVGFDPAQIAELHRHPGWGLVSMTERAEGVGGHCRIESVPGKGTRVMVEVQR